MERAVFVADLERLPSGGEYARLYLGSESCVRRLPGERELREALAVAAGRGMGFTLVTPFLDEPGLLATLALVRSLPAEPGTEVVVNDLGLLQALADAGWGGTVVAGRLLTRQRRGPGFQAFGPLTEDAREALRGSALDSPAFVGLLGACGVRRFELDDLVQGISLPALPAGVHLSLYRPWLLVTATRNCPWVFDGRTWDRDRCARPCRGRLLRLEARDDRGAQRQDPGAAPDDDPGEATSSAGASRRGQAPLRRGCAAASPSGGEGLGLGEAWRRGLLILGGCAQFLEHRSDAPLPPGVDRVVWQPEVPA